MEEIRDKEKAKNIILSKRTEGATEVVLAAALLAAGAYSSFTLYTLVYGGLGISMLGIGANNLLKPLKRG